jgi:3-oxoadipate CoA-transferase alpha subunit
LADEHDASLAGRPAGSQAANRAASHGGRIMAINKSVASAQEALAGVADGSTVMISGFGGAGFPNTLIRALRDRAPKELTLIVNSATHRLSFTHELIDAGMVRKVICSAARGRDKGLSPFEQLWKDGKIELVCLPQGTLAEAIRAGGAGIPAFFTPVGFATDLTKGKEIRVFNGREYVLEHALTADLAIIRADTSDRYGNLTFRFTQANFGPAMATAAKLAVAEVRVINDEPTPHDRVQLPGIYVDRVLVAPEIKP